MPTRKASSKKRVSKKSAKKASRKRAATRSGKKSSRKSSRKTGRKTSKKKPSSKKSKKSKKKVSKKTSKKTSKKKTAKAGKSKARRKDARKKVTSKKSASKAKAKSRKKSTKKATPGSKRKSSTHRATSHKGPAPARRKSSRRRANVLSGPVPGFSPYQPKRNEGYMSDSQLDHFRQILMAWKRELMEEVDRTMHHMKDDASNPPDPNDRATQETEFGLELRTRDRERKLLKKIESALDRIDDGSYGYCEETGDEIGLRRLEARPVATLCVEAQERRELAEKQFRDREDYYR